MKIVSVEAIALAAPFEKVFGGLDKVPPHILRPAANQVTHPRLGQATTVVRIETDDGIVGIGEALGLPTPEITAVIVAKHFKKQLLGKDPRDTTVIWESLDGASHAHRLGYAVNAIAGIDMALWDIKGKALGLPIHQLLGGAFRDRIPVYASPVPFMATPEDSAREAQAFLKRDFRAIKLKIGRGIESDLSHVAATREAIGPEVELLLDVNCGYDVPTAITFAREVRQYKPYWLEEPVEPADVEGLAEIRRRADLRIATGENEQSVFGYRELLVKQATDVLMPNIGKAGGITETARIADLARTFHVQIAPHGVGSGLAIAAALQLGAAIPNLLKYEYNQLLNPLREAVVKEKLDLREGSLMVPAGPGLGVTLDQDAIDEYVVARF
jgi:D-arabinonate dehydratase/D-galactarolactone cycloisomerase